jgi:hypothetical protein
VFGQQCIEHQAKHSLTQYDDGSMVSWLLLECISDLVLSGSNTTAHEFSDTARVYPQRQY